MALADIPAFEHPRRLDSWKEIAEYLGRDVRTATRWETQGMPLHRVPGRKGSSVFAFTNEIDAWLAGNQLHPPVADVELEADKSATVPASNALRQHRLMAVAGILVAAVATLAAAVLLPSRTGTPTERAIVAIANEKEISVTDANGTRVIHRFGPGDGVLIERTPARVADQDGDGKAEVMVGVAFYDDRDNRSIRHGELLSLSTAGEIRWRFGFGDVLTFKNESVRGPWALSDWQMGPSSSPARLAVAAHDYRWWAAIVAIVDHEGRRLGGFVNPGWMESLMWLDKDRLVIGGFSNPRNEAMVALVDVNAAEGQAPGTAGTPFACVSCGTTSPLFYATLPRSELNQLTTARFNRALVAIIDDRIQVTTTEIQGVTPATALYEFDRNFRFLRARYSETYWDTHKRLEHEGRLAHSRETCPERNGPPAIHVWTEGQGWIRTTPRALP